LPLGETPAAFVTETMAELYVQQGFTEQALGVYRQLLAQQPEDDRLRERVERLEADLRSAEGPQGESAGADARAAAAPKAGVTVRDFFAAIAARRPRGGTRSTAEAPAATSSATASPVSASAAHAEQPPVGLDAAPAAAVDAGEVALDAVKDHAAEHADARADTSSSQPADEPEPSSTFGGFADLSADDRAHAEAKLGLTGIWAVTPAETAADSSEGPTRSTADGAWGSVHKGTPGSLDALFGATSVSERDDAAASVLAGLYAPEPSSPAPATRPAESALSLDEVFRETPRSLEAARRGSAFSFDQFFAAAPEQPADAPAPEPPAEDSSAEDIEQFHAWLEGLKKK
jgi:hypothetical protein